MKTSSSLLRPVKASLLGAFAALTGGALAACTLSDTYSGGDPSLLAGAGGSGGAAGKAGSGGVGGKGGAGSDGAAGKAGAAGGPVLTACERLAEAHCGRLKASCALADPARSPAGETRCAARTKAHCEAARKLEDTNLTDSILDACAAQLGKLATLGCDERFNPLETCGLTGQRQDGDPCQTSAQCQGGFCFSAVTCGTCATRQDEGGECILPVLCKTGLACEGGSCAVRQGAGGPCQTSQGCLSGYTCFESQCKALPSGSGASCPEGLCAAASALFCNEGVCEDTLQRKVGDLCDTTAPEAEAQCPVGAWCRPSNGMNAGVCTAYTADGASCSLLTECDPPARCISGECRFFPSCEAGPLTRRPWRACPSSS